MIEGWIALYGYDDEIRIQPTLYKTKEEAVEGLVGMAPKYFSGRIKFVGEPVYVKVEAGE